MGNEYACKNIDEEKKVKVKFITSVLIYEFWELCHKNTSVIFSDKDPFQQMFAFATLCYITQEFKGK